MNDKCTLLLAVYVGIDKINLMARHPIAYMLTWTTYGSWLQGDPRGYVKNGFLRDPNPALQRANLNQMKASKTVLTPDQRRIVTLSIQQKTRELNQEVWAISVATSHVHLIVAGGDLNPCEAVRYYKNAARLAIQNNGFIGKLWTRGYSTRYAFDIEGLKNLVAYVNEHKKNNPNE